MKYANILLLLSSVIKFTAAQSVIEAYTPSVGPCPDGFSLVRVADQSGGKNTLSDSEVSYISSRKTNVLPGAWKSYLGNVQGAGVAIPSYVSSILSGDPKKGPTLAIAGSGGGFRAAIFGAGVLNALDGRNATSAKAGTGGLLQAASYYAALSGGSWLLTSLVQSNFPTINDLVFGSSRQGEYDGWKTQFDILQPGDATASMAFIGTLLREISGKFRAGFPVTIADLWSRALARHFVNGTTATDFFSNSSLHGAGITFSGLAALPAVASHSIPFPIVTNDIKSQKANSAPLFGKGIVPLSNPIFETNLFEMGSFDPMLSAFIPTKYLGTRNKTTCVTGFDQAAFVLGSSSQLFEEFNVTGTADLLNSPLGPLFKALDGAFPQPGVELDVNMYPNPFMGISPNSFIATNETFLTLIDGGEDGQDMPMAPLLVKSRGIDVIFAFDAEGDVNDFANGTSLIASAKRAGLLSSAYSFPPVPATAGEFVSKNLTRRPTLFGCDSDTSAPLVIYLANGGPPRLGHGQAQLNPPVNKSRFDPQEVRDMIDQTQQVVLQGIPADASGAKDPEWPACLACAVVDRARDRAGTQRSGVCKSCFKKYCWSGTAAASTAQRVHEVGLLPKFVVLAVLLLSPLAWVLA